MGNKHINKPKSYPVTLPTNKVKYFSDMGTVYTGARNVKKNRKLFKSFFKSNIRQIKKLLGASRLSPGDYQDLKAEIIRVHNDFIAYIGNSARA